MTASRERALGTRGPRTLRQDRIGASAVEFAFLLPVQIVVMLGIVQGGLALFVQNQLLNVTNMVGRELAVGAIGDAEAKTIALARLPSSLKSLAFSVVPHHGPAGAAKLVTVEIALPLQEAMIVDPISLLGDIELRASTTVRIE